MQDLPDGRMNNVDVLYGFSLNGRFVDLVGASNRTDDSIALYAVDPESGELSPIAARTIASRMRDIYGFCFMKSERTGRSYAFVNSKEGGVEQWLLRERGGRVDADLVRVFEVGGLTEGMVAHAATNAIFIGEERVGVWKYEAEPEWLAAGARRGDAGVGFERPRSLVAFVGRDPIVADVEGLAVYPMDGDRGGYLLVSSQGDSTFAVFEVTEPHGFLFSFRVGASGTIDEVTGTDGIAVCAADLGPRFPSGVFVAQDDVRPGSGQNFKIVAWERIAEAGSLRSVRGGTRGLLAPGGGDRRQDARRSDAGADRVRSDPVRRLFR